MSDSEKKEIRDKLYEQYITNISADYFHIVYCPWCGTYVSTVIDFDKGVHVGRIPAKKTGRDWTLILIILSDIFVKFDMKGMTG